MFFIIFFFKQKTAYEMRISDWSSDVCSSDLRQRVLSAEPDLALPGPAGGGTRRLHAANVRSRHQGGRQRWRRRRLTRNDHYHPRHANARARCRTCNAGTWPDAHSAGHRTGRSEEHMSELQSLMRISYAVFCVQHKNHKKID